MCGINSQKCFGLRGILAVSSHSKAVKTYNNTYFFFRDPQITGGPNESDVLLGLIPFFHGYGWGMLLVALAAKAPIVVMSMFDETLFLETIQNYKVSLELTFYFFAEFIKIFLSR